MTDKPKLNKKRTQKLFNKAVAKLEELNIELVKAYDDLERATSRLGEDETLNSKNIAHIATNLLQNSAILARTTYMNLTDKNISEDDAYIQANEEVEFLVHDVLFGCDEDCECNLHDKVIDTQLDIKSLN